MILQTQASTISAGAIAAGANVLLTGKTYSNPVTSTTLTVAVGDRVFVESGTGTAGSQDNDIVEAYITEVSSTDNNVKLSKDIVAVQSGKFVTGWLTGYDTGGQINVFASDTNKDGTSKKLAFKTDADTQQVSLWFFVKGTSTVKHELFFDNVLLSGNKFLQASSQLPQIVYAADQPATNSYADNTGVLGLGDALMTGGTMEFGSQQEFDSYMTISGSPTKFEVHKDCEIHFYFSGHTGTANRFLSLYKNTTTISADGYFVGGANVDADGSSSFGVIDTHFKFKAGDFFSLAIGDMGGGSTATMSSTSQRCQLRIGIKPVQSDVILLESQDEIFTDWQEYTPTFTGAGSGTDTNIRWRRVGSNMEIKGYYDISTTAASTWSMTLPSGYAIDTSVGVNSTTYLDGGRYIIDAGNAGYHGGIISYLPGGTKVFRGNDSLYYGNGINFNPITPVNGNAGGAGANPWNLNIKVPIQGWNANFNPLLSMPLVDFSSFENHFVAKIDGSSTTGVIVTNSQSPYDWVDTITRNSQGHYTFTYAGLGLSHAPNVTASGTRVSSHVAVTSVSSTSCQVVAYDPFFDVYRDDDFWVSLTKVASDYVQPPQPTAAVIKPAVAYIQDIKAENTTGGTVNTSPWQARTLNTISGESWFVTLSGTGTTGVGGTNTDFTLEPGTYKFNIRSPFYRAGDIRIRLYNITNSVVSGIGASLYSTTDTGGTDFAYFEALKTFTASTKLKVEYSASNNPSGTSGLGNATDDTGYNEVYTTVQIEKLK
jgi:hypothetical protein